jgi:hypothetical protein
MLSLPDRKLSYLEPGDVITHVDGRRINTMADYYHAMYLSGARNGKVKLSVIDVNTNQNMEFEARAERVGGGRARVKPLGEATRATKVKAILIAATDDKTLKDGATENLKIMERYVTGLPIFDPRTDLVVLKGADLRAKKIMDAIESLDIEPTETLLCYVASHGAHDEAIAEGDPSGGHFFSFNDGHLTRRSLLGALTDRGGQLTVLITDTCNAPSIYVPPSVTGIPPEPIESKVFTELLFGYEGVIDVSGSSKGQYGWYDGRGGWFTMSLIGTVEQMDRMKGSTDVDWKKFLDTAATNQSETFQSKKKAALDKPAPTDPAQKDAIKKLQMQADQRLQPFQLVVKPVRK